MKYLTKTECAELFGITRQAVDSRINSGSLVMADVKVTEKRVAIEDTLYENLKLLRLARGKAQA